MYKPEEEYIEFGADPRERGRFVQRGGELFYEQGGGFIEGPNGRIQVPGRRVKAERDSAGIPVMPSESELRMNQDTPVGLGNEELRRLNEQDRAMGQSAVREFERFERGELSDTEIAKEGRRRQAEVTPDVEMVRAQGPA